ncbi:Bug family tripartite tricarboxylate transporter substrate binding protein [Roseinatronobacter bogoriensis]|uniref:Tripartite tricarboxylate transporter substrate binding protein n=1 Tax=Roseinatronobacter bogoriensis subsp. barguzinensis TaxID=441209 RepID=A0A2K8K7A6_9RHOB|nr:MULTISPECIES: tripartite tricarboxylate transporter substrate binding protein [Rhodobaca]ATX65337.1 tripartite tricarboxylate transporter substrate binding protein [Rhodobaca barguzinensis]MBB4208912.1 tripartite-type tricarboxylate transporter receptor subunit TctC [Rhodobaca bogoriensis DSM 18756]TDW37662.1 tripartite-type tricarboxylate transporter receptor subunit TctC [Rhodobaca barguzinensis]TDY68272.1 tripartite-type tricarboxylate transporter receptor subunit TctC [Rhodobaca bogorien
MTYYSRIIAGAGLAVAMTVQPVLAQDYPTRPVEFIVPWAPGGGSDILMRIVANNIGQYLGAEMPVINIGGVGGTVGLAEAASRAADGYTISQIHEGLLTATAVGMTDLAWDDFEPIALMTASPQYLVAATDQPFDTFEGMVEYAQANPNALTIGVTLGGVPHLHAAMIAEAFDIEWRYVGYEGTGERIRAVVGGNLDVAIGDISSSLQFAENGDLIFLASGTEERVAQTPDVPTFAELGADLDLLITRGIVMPKGAPEEAQATLEAALEQLSQDETFIQQINNSGADVLFRGREDYFAYLDTLSATVERLSEVIAP